MSLAPLAPSMPTVIVDPEAPADASLWTEPDGTRVLVLRPLQSFSNAVTQISSLMPGMHPDQVRAVVRCYLPDAADFDTVESTWRGTVSVPAVDLGLTREERDRRSKLRCALTYMSLGSVAAAAVALYLVVDSPGADDKPFEGKAFEHFAKSGKMLCDPINPTHAKCTDTDGTVMFSTVMTSPDATIFNFAYGSETVVMRVFPKVTSAMAWAAADGSRELYDNLTRSGRYVFYGTDKARVRAYAALVGKADPKGNGPERALSSVPDLPERIGGLAFGALNLPADPERIQLVSDTQELAVATLLGEAPRPLVRRAVPHPAMVATASVLHRPHTRATPSALPSLPLVYEVMDEVEDLLPRVLAPAPQPSPTKTATPAPTKTEAPASPSKQEAEAVPAPAPTGGAPVVPSSDRVSKPAPQRAPEVVPAAPAPAPSPEPQPTPTQSAAPTQDPDEQSESTLEKVAEEVVGVLPGVGE